MVENSRSSILEELRVEFLKGRNPMAYIAYAHALLDDKQLYQALDVCRQGLRNRPVLAGRHLLASIFFTMGRYEDTLEALTEVLREAPESFSANLLHARTLAKRREWDEANEVLDRLRQASPADRDVCELSEAIAQELKRLRSANTDDSQVRFVHPPANYSEFKAIVKKHLGSRPEVGFCFFQAPQEGNILEEAEIEALFGMILSRSSRIVAELGLGKLQGLMMDYDTGCVLVNEAGEEFLVSQFSMSVPPGQMRRTIAQFLSLKP